MQIGADFNIRHHSEFGNQFKTVQETRCPLYALRHEQKPSNRNNLVGGADLCCRGQKHGSCSCTFAAQQSFEKHRTEQPAKPEASGGFIFRKEAAKPRKGYGHWLLPPRVSSRGRRTSDNRANLAGDAAVAQSQLGSSGAGEIPRALCAARR